MKHGQGSPQCFVCYKVLGEGSMKPSLLKRNFSSCHPELANKGAAYFKRLEVGLKIAHLDQPGHVSQQNQAGLQASYMVALRIAQQKKPHNIGEKLILPCCKDIVRCMNGDGAESNLPLCLCQTTQFREEYLKWLRTSNSRLLPRYKLHHSKCLQSSWMSQQM